MTSTDASARVAPLTAKRESSPVDVKAPSPRSPKDQSRQFIKPLLKSHRELNRPPFDCIALVLQGGGALGAFPAGVHQGLAEANLHPDWVAGISIGAINAALIAGNAPEARLEKLRAFWEQVTTQMLFDPFGIAHYWLRGDMVTSSSIGCAPKRLCSRGLQAFSNREFRRLISQRRARSRPPAGTTPRRCGARWSGSSISIASTPARCVSASAPSTTAAATSCTSIRPPTKSGPS